MNFSKITAFLLDFDGTLVDSEPIHFAANAAAFLKYGHKIDEKEYYVHWSLLGESAAGEIHRHQLTGIDPETVKSEGAAIFRKLISEQPVRLLPGAAEFLETLSGKGYQAVIASNTPEDYVRRILEAAQLPLRIPVVGRRPGLRPKPFPDIFIAAMEEIRCTPAECLVVEDTIKGLRAAKAAGCRCAVVRSFRYPTDTEFPGADIIVPDLYALLKLIPDRLSVFDPCDPDADRFP